MALLAALAVLAGGVAIIGAPTPVAAQSAPPEPIVFVHGWHGRNSEWDSMRSRFSASGFPWDRTYTFGYNSDQSIKTSAAQLNSFIDQVRGWTGSQVVDVVSHSMGALVSRWCIKSTGCNGKVDDWVSLAGANHGTSLSLCFWWTSCPQMFYQSDFVKELNRGDETPGTATYAALWSDRDTVIVPNSSARLADGAWNIRVSIGHNDFQRSQAVFDIIRPILVD